MLIAAVEPRTGACGEKILVHVASVSTTTTSDLTKLDPDPSDLSGGTYRGTLIIFIQTHPSGSKGVPSLKLTVCP